MLRKTLVLSLVVAGAALVMWPSKGVALHTSSISDGNSSHIIQIVSVG
jgi:hypothetical protein